MQRIQENYTVLRQVRLTELVLARNALAADSHYILQSRLH